MFTKLVCFSILLAQVRSEDLRAVALVHRHGHRTPTGTYPNDPYSNSYPEGYGALTLRGIKMMFFHGERLRKRYESLVGNSGWYTSSNIKILSTNFERTIMSAQSFMAGFLPPSKPNPLPIDWQPVAVSTLDPSKDNMLRAVQKCPKYDLEFAQLNESPPVFIRDFLASRPDLFQNLTEELGQDIKTSRDLFNFHNIVKVQRDNDLELPAWAYDFIDTVMPFQQEFFALFTHSKYMKKAKYGALITDIILNLERAVQSDETQKIYEYSGQDYTVLGLGRLLGVEAQIDKIPNYGATISFELEKSTDVIKVFYWRSADSEKPFELELPCCPSPCSLQKFRETYSYFLIEPPTQETYAEICALD